MQYTDEQRISKIIATVDKLIAYVKDTGLTREQILNDETVRWTLTTPLYKIFLSMLIVYQKSLRNLMQIFLGVRYQVLDIGWFTITRIPVGQ